MERKIIIGNWKMNPRTEEEAMDLVREIVNKYEERDEVEIGVAPPFVFLEGVSNVILKRNIRLGAQDVFWEDQGAYTGEVSVDELKSLGADFVIVGHSERRRLGETDKQVNKKVRQSLNSDFQVILCVGEPKGMRDKGVDVAKRFVSGELEKDLEKTKTALGRSPENLIIAYEPLWAISSEEGSEPATPEKAVEMISFIRKFLEVNEIAKAGETRVLYGGSVDSENAGEFLGRDEIDGALVGGASLEADEFVGIIESIE